MDSTYYVRTCYLHDFSETTCLTQNGALVFLYILDIATMHCLKYTFDFGMELHVHKYMA